MSIAISTVAVVVGGLVIERALGPDFCDEVDDSLHGHADWSWAPPGTRCRYQSAVNDRYFVTVDPPWTRLGGLVVAIMLGLVSTSRFRVEQSDGRLEH
jgi:hypothetical protein